MLHFWNIPVEKLFLNQNLYSLHSSTLKRWVEIWSYTLTNLEGGSTVWSENFRWKFSRHVERPDISKTRSFLISFSTRIDLSIAQECTYFQCSSLLFVVRNWICIKISCCPNIQLKVLMGSFTKDEGTIYVVKWRLNVWKMSVLRII